MNTALKISLFTFLMSAHVLPTTGQTIPLSERMATTAITLFKDRVRAEPGRPEKWSYEQGVVLLGVEAVWRKTRDQRYFRFIQDTMDRFVSDDGTIKTYRVQEYNIDNVLNGRVLLLLFEVTGRDKYKKAAALIREQLNSHPRTSDGGFWHKQIYPSQMWLDGLYMGAPFYTEFAAKFHDGPAFDDIAKQFILMEKHARDDKTGLLYHGWDESRKQRWANPKTGHSPSFWGRAMGWYAMALVDTLHYFPKAHPKRNSLIAILNRLAAAIERHQDSKSGLWYLVVDKTSGQGNYLESSAACMFVYALARGVREGYLPRAYHKTAAKGYEGIIKEFIETDTKGHVNLKGTVRVAGLGGTPYRDGSYQYYLSEKVVTNDPKGIGPFLMASAEIERTVER